MVEDCVANDLPVALAFGQRVPMGDVLEIPHESPEDEAVFGERCFDCPVTAIVGRTLHDDLFQLADRGILVLGPFDHQV